MMDAVSDPSVVEDVRVVLVDDHELVRRGIRALLDTEAGINVVGEAESGPEAVVVVSKQRPDVVVMDARMPGGDGVSACRALRDAHPSLGVIMLTSYPDDEARLAAIMAGAAGFVLKRIGGRDLVHAIKRVGTGESLLEPGAAQRVIDRLREADLEGNDAKLARLTSQELRILESVGAGLTNREIARKVHLSDKTVKNYVSSILHKLEVSRRAEAASYLVRARVERELASHSPIDAVAFE